MIPVFEKNYQYSIDFLQRINESVLKNDADLKLFQFEDHNLWFFYQSALFSDIKVYSANKKVPTETHLNLNGFVLSFFFLLISFFSLFFLVLIRKKVMVFSVDSLSSKFKSDYRLEFLYRFLHTNNISFFELFHTIVNKETTKRIINRKRFAVYLESVDFLFFLKQKILGKSDLQHKIIAESVSLELFSEEEKAFASYCIRRYFEALSISKFRVKFFRKILSHLGVKAVLAIDDTRHYNELLLAAKLCNIPSIAFQHGHYTKYHVGWLRQNLPGDPISPTILCVWSEYWKNELQRLNSVFPTESVFVMGPTLNAAQIKIDSIRKKLKKDTLIKVLIPYETDAPKGEISEFMKKLIKLPNVKIIFKIRPNRDKQSQLSEYKIENFDLHIARNLSEIIDEIDVVGGVYSTILYDMVSLEKPVFIMKTSMDYGEGMIKNKLADLLKLDEVEEKMYEIASTPLDVLTSRREKIVGKNPQDPGVSLKPIFKKYNII